MSRVSLRRSAALAGFIACAGVLGAVRFVATAADINSVTGPLPTDLPAAAQCAAVTPAAQALGLAPGRATRGLNDATASPPRATVDGSAKVTQTWTNCKGTLPRGVSASIEVTLPGIPGVQGNRGTNVQWGPGRSSQPASPTLLR